MRRQHETDDWPRRARLFAQRFVVFEWRCNEGASKQTSGDKRSKSRQLGEKRRFDTDQNAGAKVERKLHTRRWNQTEYWQLVHKHPSQLLLCLSEIYFRAIRVSLKLSLCQCRQSNPDFSAYKFTGVASTCWLLLHHLNGSREESYLPCQELALFCPKKHTTWETPRQSF